MKTKDTYMKLSWLTVAEDSMDKEYGCIVKHENNQRGVDQEIFFPPIDKGMCTLMYMYFQKTRVQGNDPIVIICIDKK